MAQTIRSKMTLETNQEIGLPLLMWRDDDGQPMAAAASAGKFGQSVGGWGTGGIMLVGELANANTKTDQAFFELVLPQNYETGTDLTVVVQARVGAALNTAATLDFEAYLSDENGGVGSDLCATAAQSVNSATWAEYSFTITGTTLAPGRTVELYMQGVANDSGGTTNNGIQIGRVYYKTSTRM